MTPSIGGTLVTTSIAIAGHSFYQNVVNVDLDGKEQSVVDGEFSVTLENASGMTELEQIQWMSPESLLAVVPAGMPEGTYDLVVTGPLGSSDTLVDAFTISDADPSVQFRHGGWADVVALGPKRDALGSYLLPDGTTSGNLADSDQRITVVFNDFADASADGYQVFRATASGQQDFATPIFTIDDPAQRSFTDLDLVPGTAYFYVVRPTISGTAYPTGESYSEIRVVAPPDNMALVHRWIANQEICSLMPAANASTIDPNNDYRCDFTGQGSTASGHHDLGHDLLVDRFESGCDTTQADVLYDPASAFCSHLGVIAPNATAASLGIMSSNAPLLPPLGWVDQFQAALTCDQKAVTITDATGSLELKARLLSQKEWNAAAAWTPDLSDAEISMIEGGALTAGTGYCNTNNAHGGTEQGTPDRAGIGSGFFRTGSLAATSDCLSRYGLHDMVGNVYEWTSEQCSWSGSTCIATGVIDPNNLDIDGFVNPLGNAVPITNAPYFSPALGIPLTTVEDGAHAMADFGVARLHEDRWFATPTLERGMLAGGFYTDGNGRGRWNRNWNFPPDGVNDFSGIRCGLALP